MDKIKQFLHYFSHYGFAVIMLLMGVFDLFQPQPLRDAMDAIQMPSYLLLILGVFKILGSLCLLLNVHWRLKEWAYAGFFIWAAGAISSHLLVDHSFSKIAPVLVLLMVLILNFFSYLKTRGALHRVCSNTSYSAKNSWFS